MDFNQHKQLEFRRKFWKLFGAAIHITDPISQQMVGYIEMKAWKLREDIRIYTDTSKSTELMRIHARSIIDFGATYDIYDSASGQPLFSLQRKGLRSTFVRDHWNIFDVQGQPYGTIQETSSGLALVRRWINILPYVGDLAEAILGFVPQTYEIRDNIGNLMAQLAHRKNPFVVKFGLDTTHATVATDMRIPVASVALLSVIDANKNN
jgi:hypothetical protein